MNSDLSKKLKIDY